MLACLVTLLVLQTPELLPETTRLDSGLRVMVVPDHTLPLVSVQLWYRVGSARDPVEQPGLCNVARAVLEQRGESGMRLRALGARTESRTLRDGCYLAATVPPGLVESVLAVQAQRMQPRQVTPQELAAGLLGATRAAEPDHEDGRPYQELLAALLAEHPYRHPPDFVADSLRSLSPTACDAFMERWFVPGNATLFIIGDVQPAQVVDAVRRHFDQLPWAEPPARAWPDLPPAGNVTLSPRRAARPGFEMGWIAPAAGSVDATALDVLMQHLCNPVDGRLDRKLADLEAGVPVWQHESWREAGIVHLSFCYRSGAAGDEGDADALEAQRRKWERVVRGVLEEVAASRPSELQFNRARALAEQEWRQRRASFHERAIGLAGSEIIAGDLLLDEWELDRIRGLVVADLARAAEDLLNARTVSRLWSPAVVASNAASGIRPLPAPLEPKPPRLLSTADALSLLADQAAGLPPICSPQPPGKVIRREVLEGVKATVCSIRGLTPAVVRTLVRGRDVQRFTMAAVLAVGSEERSVEQYRDYLAYYGLDLLPLADPLPVGLTSTGPAERVPQLIELQADLIRHPNRSRRACAAARENLWAMVGAAAAPPPGFARERRSIPPGLIGWDCSVRFLPDHAAGVWERLAGLNAIDEVEVVVVGNVDAEEVLSAVEALWSGFEPAGVERAEGGGDSEPRIEAGRVERTISGWMIDETEPAMVYIDDTLVPSTLPPAERELALDCLCWTLGVSLGDSRFIDGGRAWCWTVTRLGPRWINTGAPVGPEGPVELLRRQLENAERTMLARQPPRQFQMALRLARAQRLNWLDGATAIADRLSGGLGNPWDLLEGRSAESVAGLVAQLYRVELRRIAGSGPEDFRSELEQFEAPGERSSGDSP